MSRLLPCCLALAVWLASPGPAGAATVTVACAAVGIEYRLCREGAEAWAERAGHQVELIQTPSLANERLALFQQLLASGSSDIDVFQIDVVWPGILGRFFIDLTDHVPAEEIAAHFPPLVENNTVDGELKAMPWYADAGLLYYRRDLLERYGLPPPTTWDDLAAAARTVMAGEHAAGNRRMTGFVFQAKAYEGLTCNALEWIASFGGGRLLAPDGRLDLVNPQAVEAIATAASWVGDIAPRGVLNYAEEEARGVFQSGNAVFMRNWPYAWALANAADSPLRGRVGISRLPRGGSDGRHASTLGGGGLAVSVYSRNPGPAAALVRHLTGLAEQVRRAVVGGFNPTIAAAYQDPALLEAQPFMADLPTVLAAAVPRPARITGSRYNQFSTTVWNAVHDTLSGNGGAARNLAAAERRLERISRGGRW